MRFDKKMLQAKYTNFTYYVKATFELNNCPSSKAFEPLNGYLHNGVNQCFLT